MAVAETVSQADTRSAGIIRATVGQHTECCTGLSMIAELLPSSLC